MNWTTVFWDNVVTLSLKALIMYYAWNVLRILPPRTKKNGLESHYILDGVYQSNIVTFILGL
jgi:hypothetical protein